MWKPRVLLGVLALSLIASSQVIHGQDPSVIRRAKQATALLITATGANATAFCIHEDGYFVASSSAVQAAGNGPIGLVVNPTEANERAFDATVEQVDTASSMAILRMKGSGGCVKLELGDSGTLSETTPFVAFGYPLGRTLRERGARFPSITVSTGRVAALRKENGVLERIQLDVSLAEGSGGGPVLDEQGKVVGIVYGGLSGTGLVFATPVERLKALYSKPVITFSPTSVPFDKARESRELKAELRVIGGNLAGYTVDLELTGSDGSRTLALKPNAAGVYSINTPLLIPHSGPERLRVAVRYPDGWIIGEILDREIRVGGNAVKLSDIAAIQSTPKQRVALTNGKLIESGVDAPGTITLDIAGKAIGVDLPTARETLVSIAHPPGPRQPYALIAKKNGEVVNRLTGSIELTGAPASASSGSTSTRNTAPRSITPTPMTTDITTIELPAVIEDATVAGGGRYLIFLARRLRQLLVFDVNSGTIARTLPLPSDNVLIAGSANDLVVVSTDIGLIQRWSLDTMQRELTVGLPARDWRHVSMGYSSNGPLLALTPGGPRYVDVATLSLLNIRKADGTPPGNEYFPREMTELARMEARTSPNGNFSVITYPGSARTRVITLNGLMAAVDRTELIQGAAFPSGDSSVLVTRSGLYSPTSLKAADDFCTQKICIPAVGAPYVVMIPDPALGAPRGRGAVAAAPEAAVYAMTGRKLLAPLSGVSVSGRTTPPNSFNQQTRAVKQLPVDKRVFMIPAANLLVTINIDQDELTLRRVVTNAK